MSKAVIEITSTGEGDKVNIEVSFNGSALDKTDPAHLAALRIAEALYQGNVSDLLENPDKVEVVH